MKKNKIRVFVLIFGLIQCVYGQQRQQYTLAFPGPKYTMVLMPSTNGTDSIRRFVPYEERYMVERSDEQSDRYKKLGEVYFPKSAAELEKRLGNLASDVRAKLGVTTGKEVYETLLRVGPDTLGMLLIYTEVQEALGMVFLDSERKPNQPSSYRITAGGKRRTGGEFIVDVSGELPQYVDRFKLTGLMASDSVVNITWQGSQHIANTLMPMFAQVYKRKGHRGRFEVASKLFLLTDDRSDSSQVFFSDNVLPGEHLSYFVKLEDMAGNEGVASDTAFALAVSPAAMLGIEDLRATDTLDGVFLQWEPLPDQAVYVGVQILKSRALGSDYVVLDTIPATETSYLDSQVIPSSSYFYKVRPLLFNVIGAEPKLFAETSGYFSSRDARVPAAPTQVAAQVVSEGVLISWEQADELDLFGYYVLRGTSLKDMEVLSLPVQNTSFLDTAITPGFSGQLHYAVQAINLKQSVGDTSQVASVFLRQAVVLMPPGGLGARRDATGVVLQWDDVMRRDDKVEGFVVYRQDEVTATFIALTEAALRVPFFTDSTAQQEQTYTYAVTSIDSWGNQSIFSPTAMIRADQSQRLVLPQELYLRNVEGGIEVSWPNVDFEKGEEYLIYRREVGKPTFINLASVAPDAVFVDSKIQADILYEYCVALDKEGLRSTAQSIRSALSK